MKLNNNIANKFGALVSIAFIIATEERENNPEIEKLSMEFLDIIMNVKRGSPYDGTHIADKLMDLYMQSIYAEIGVYQPGASYSQSILDNLAQEVADNANESERQYCLDTLRSFVNKLADSLNRPELIMAFMGPLTKWA